MIQINGTEIAHWADTIQARSMLPELIRRLISSTVDMERISRLDFPSGDAVQKPGYDGMLEVTVGNAWVPTGSSVWEMGTDKQPTSKANKDYLKRGADPLRVDQSKSVYVFVTPRRWSGKQVWITQKNSEGHWKEVCAFDADDLAQWLEQAPSVTIWLAEQIGKPMDGLRFIEEALHEYCSLTEPELTHEVILAGRDAQVKSLESWFSESQVICVVQSDSPAEALAFICAGIESLPEELKNYWKNRTVIIDKDSVERIPSAQSEQLFILNSQNKSQLLAQIKKQGHRALIPCGKDTNDQKGKQIAVPRVDRYALEKALVSSGLAEHKADQLARQSGSSLTVLQRLLHNPAMSAPAWAHLDVVEDLLPALLVGGWDECKTGDVEAIEKLARKNYSEVSGKLAKWVHDSDAPLRKVGSVWKLTSPLDAWLWLGRYLTASHLSNFREVLHEALTFNDPKFELDAENRYMANVYGKVFPHSDWMRKGLCESLVILATYGENSQVPVSGSPQGWVDMAIRRLIENAKEIRWLSISDLLPMIAEASPDEFLTAIEDDLPAKSPKIMALFKEEKGMFGSNCHHAGLLWALELLAWSPLYIGRVAGILAALTRMDLGGQWANRPKASLHEIFLSWRHQTSIEIDAKVEILERLLSTEPDVTWNLLVSLLPRSHEVSSPTETPHWRDWACEVESEVNADEHFTYVLKVLELAMKTAGIDGSRLADLTNQLGSIPGDKERALFTAMEQCAGQPAWSAGKEILRKKLRGYLYWHRSFADENWTLNNPGLIDRVAGIYDLLTPEDAMEKHSWLFQGWPELPSGERKGHDAYRQRIDEERRDAIEEIHQAIGLTGLLRLAEKSDHPDVIGFHMAEVLHERGADQFIKETCLGVENTNFVSLGIAYFVKILFEEGSDWAEQLLADAKSKEWGAEKAGDLFSAFPATLDLWMKLQPFGKDTEQRYWKRLNIYGLNTSKEMLEFAVNKLVEHERPKSAVEMIRFDKDEVMLPFDVVARILDAVLMANQEEQISLSGYEIEPLFLMMDSATGQDREKIIQLEIQYSAILEDTNRGLKFLSQLIEDEPGWFVEMIRWQFKPKNEIAEEWSDEMSPEERSNRASVAYRVLHAWRGIPGLKDDVLDKKFLAQWIASVRESCLEIDRIEVADLEIGHVLARSPEGDDSIKPMIEVREIIEDLRNRDIERGFYFGVVNSRGVTRRAMNEGGRQEREIEQKYRSQSKALAPKWPRTSRIISLIADSYASGAKREDNDALLNGLRD